MAKREEAGVEDSETHRDILDSIKEIISQPRRKIVESISEEESKRYSDFLKEHKLTTGNLNYHLMRLQNKGLLVKEGDDYRLTPMGKEAVRRVKRLL